MAQGFGGDESTAPPQSLSNAFIWSTATSVAPVIAGLALWQTQDGVMQIAGISLAAAGYVFGPSSGSVYLNDPDRAWIGLAIRGGGLSALSAGLLLGFGSGPSSNTAVTTSSVLISLSAMAIPYGLAYNFSTLNASHENMQLRVATAYDRESGTMVPALVLRF